MSDFLPSPLSHPNAVVGAWGDGVALYGDKVEVHHWIESGADDWHAKAVAAIRGVFDPEIPLNVYDLGLIYRIDTLPGGLVRVEMTLTSPSCPEAEALPSRVEMSLRDLPETQEVDLELVWDPAWGPERMSEEAQLELGFY